MYVVTLKTEVIVIIINVIMCMTSHWLIGWNNMPALSAYGLYISQLTQMPRVCGSYHDILRWGLLLTRKLMNQGLPPWLG